VRQTAAAQSCPFLRENTTKEKNRKIQFVVHCSNNDWRTATPKIRMIRITRSSAIADTNVGLAAFSDFYTTLSHLMP